MTVFGIEGEQIRKTLQCPPDLEAHSYRWSDTAKGTPPILFGTAVAAPRGISFLTCPELTPLLRGDFSPPAAACSSASGAGG